MISQGRIQSGATYLRNGYHLKNFLSSILCMDWKNLIHMSDLYRCLTQICNYGTNSKLRRVLILLYTGKISPPFYFRPFRPLVWERIQNWANWIIHKLLYNKTQERANSRLDESVSDLCRAKIRLGEFKAVYSILDLVIIVELYRILKT